MKREERLTPELRKFLDSEGVTKQFLNNVEFDLDVIDQVYSPFVWEDTTEGFRYWSDLDQKYIAIQMGA